MASPSTRSCSAIDDTFGPYAGKCRGSFDFTIFFEEIFLSIVPLSILLLAAPFRIVYLWSRDTKVRVSVLLYLKLVAYAFFAAFEIAILIIWVEPSTVRNRASIPSAALSVVTVLALCLLSIGEHLRSVQPSFLLNVYLTITVVFDIARSRSLALQYYSSMISTLFATRVGIKVVLVILEARSKRRLLLVPYDKCPPEETSGPWSKAFFWWQNPLLRRGFSNTLSIDDLFDLDKHLQSNHLQRLLQSAWDNVSDRKPNSLFSMTLKKLKWALLAVVFPRACLIAFNFCQPFLINRAVSYSQEAKGPLTNNTGYGLIGAYFLVYVGIAISTGQYQHFTYRAITMIRGGMISMLYTKATDISIASVDAASSLTLMSADIERITMGMQTAHEIWANVCEVAIAIYLLQGQLGVACVVPIGVAIVSLVGSLGATTLVVQRQALWLQAIERRIAATSAMLGSMKGVKMSGLTDVLRADLQGLRVQELEISKKFRMLLIWTMGFSYLSQVLSPILTFAVFSALARNSNGHTTLDTARVFTSLSLFTLLSDPLGSLIMSLSSFMGAVGSFQRIQEFLDTESRKECRKLPPLYYGSSVPASSSGTSSGKGSDASDKSRFSFERGTLQDYHSMSSTQAVVIEDGFFGWDKVKQPAGCLQSINLVVPRAKLTMVVGPVGCGKSTLLKAVLGELPVMGGLVQLSSSRIALCDQTPWHMNGTVQQSIVAVSEFDQRWYASVIRSCALDEDLRHLPQGDQTQIGSKGIALSGGQSQRIALARAIYAQKDIVILDDCLSGLDTQTENRVWHSLFGRDGLLKRCRSTVLVASSSAKRLPYADHIVALNSSGKIAEQGSFDALNKSGGYVADFDLPSPDWDFLPEKHNYEAPPKYTERAAEVAVTEDTIQAEANRRIGDVSIYLYYIRSVGWTPSIIFMVSITIFIFGISFPNLWVKWWASANAKAPNERLGYYLGIYAMLGVLALVFLIVGCWQLIITMVPRSGVAFHWKLLQTVLNAPMSFFATTDTGVTLNRFSQDLQLIDMELPVAALNTFATLILCFGQLALIGIASPYAAISFPVCFVAVYLIQMFYLRTSRQLRFLDLEAKSPLYTQFTEMLAGLATVRAFGWQSFLEEKNRELLDRSQRPFYLLFAVQRWLTLVLDLVVAGMAVLLIILVVALKGQVSSGYVGVALLNVIQFAQSIKLLISFWTQLETHIGSVARIKTFTSEAVSENLEDEDQEPPPEWPSEGKIEFKKMSASYRAYDPVINNLSFTITGGEKVAIVGRTGSGKSSLVATLFRMLDYSHGSIHIDGLPLHRIPRQTIRSRVLGLPQDPYLLPGSVRLNADPTKQYTDKQIMAALKDVELWDIVVGKGDESKYTHPLDGDVEELHFSAGQKQLFCLARAILRSDRGRVVVLDEATSSLDHNSDTHVQRLIRSKFASHTVIAVAHKLDTILDFDKVAVMHHGSLVEYGEPYRLLEDQDSAFSKLYSSSHEGAGDDQADLDDIAQ